jgi:hypothetical protein
LARPVASIAFYVYAMELRITMVRRSPLETACI